MPVLAGVMLRRFMVVVLGVEMVSVRYMRVVRRLLVIAGLMVLGRFFMVGRGVA